MYSNLIVHHIAFHGLERLSRQKSASQEDSYIKTLAGFLDCFPHTSTWLACAQTQAVTSTKWHTEHKSEPLRCLTPTCSKCCISLGVSKHPSFFRIKFNDANMARESRPLIWTSLSIIVRHPGCRSPKVSLSQHKPPHHGFHIQGSWNPWLQHRIRDPKKARDGA